MEISKKKILTGSAGRCVTDQFTLEEDYNVPDNRDDIGRVPSSEERPGSTESVT